MIIILAVWGMVACQTLPYQPYARNVKKKPDEGGVIALRAEYRDEDLNKAKSMMASNCVSSNFKIIEEGEVIVGEKMDTQTDQSYNHGSPDRQVGSLFGVPVVSGQSPSSQARAETTRTQLREWQISYECLKPTAATNRAAQNKGDERETPRIRKLQK